MTEVFALLAGVDRYPGLVDRNLRGAVNDVEAVQRFLHETAGDRAHVRVLRDAEASRAGVIDGFRHHLGRARPGDSALFWFSGHGSTARVPPYWWHLEEDGASMQTLVCADSRVAGTPDLLDKELAVLIGDVAARGVLVTAVLDCCHAGGGTRTPSFALARRVGPASVPPDLSRLLPELSRQVAAGPRPRRTADHVALAACGRNQLAYEMPDHERVPHGLFTAGLLAQLRRPGPTGTYRELVAGARRYVEQAVDGQAPEAYPAMGAAVDTPFLGGCTRPPEATMTLHHQRGRWLVDAGSCHGIPAGGDGTRFAVQGSSPSNEVVVTGVDVDRCVVEPVGWQPDAERTYPVVLSHTPVPAIAVAVGGGPDDDAGTAERIVAAIATAGPGGSPSPHLLVVPPGDPARRADLLVDTPVGADPVVRGVDGAPLATGAAGPDPWGQVPVVARLEHIARWRAVRQLENPFSRLAGLVRISVLRPLAGERVTPDRRPGLPLGATGTIAVEYQPSAPPSVFIRLDNRSDRELYCVLLVLTDRHCVHADLFPGSPVAAGASAAAAGGRCADLVWPSGRPLEPGARMRDWLMLVVTEDRINAEHFEMPAIDEPRRGECRTPTGLVRTVERLAMAANQRDLRPPPVSTGDWWTSVVEIVSTVPDPARAGPPAVTAQRPQP